jgi:hypothetical protein
MEPGRKITELEIEGGLEICLNVGGMDQPLFRRCLSSQIRYELISTRLEGHLTDTTEMRESIEGVHCETHGGIAMVHELRRIEE